MAKVAFAIPITTTWAASRVPNSRTPERCTNAPTELSARPPQRVPPRSGAAGGMALLARRQLVNHRPPPQRRG